MFCYWENQLRAHPLGLLYYLFTPQGIHIDMRHQQTQVIVHRIVCEILSICELSLSDLIQHENDAYTYSFLTRQIWLCASVSSYIMRAGWRTRFMHSCHSRHMTSNHTSTKIYRGCSTTPWASFRIYTTPHSNPSSCIYDCIFCDA